MERNTITTIDNLQLGDRFYKVADSKKELFTKVHVKPLKNKYTCLKHGAIKDGEKFPVHFKTDTKLVFLRSTVEVNV